MKNELLKFWAKTTDDKDDPGRRNAYHPLICHLIDVGVTAERLWNQVLPEITKKRLARQFGIKEDLPRAGNLIAFLAGLHDLGKCSPPFTLRGKNDSPASQTRRLIELYKNTECDCDDFNRASEVPHGFVTSVELPAILIDKLKFPKTFAENIAEIIGGHHGVFAASGKLNDIKRFGAKSVGDRTWSESRFEFAETLERLFKIEGDFSGLPDVKLDNATAMIFAGLTSVADWIGSNTDFFPCEVGDSTIEFSLDPDAYLKKSRANAERALRTLGWKNWITKSKAVTFDELFPEIKEKRDLQNAAIDIAQTLNSTGIAIIESPMGEGKTEAAERLSREETHTGSPSRLSVQTPRYSRCVQLP